MTRIHRTLRTTFALAAGLLLNLVSVAPAASATVDVTSSTPLLGIGINRMSYWSRSQATTDLARGGEFRGLDWSYDVGADANGLPTRDFQFVFSSTRKAAGTYKLRYTGRASVSVATTAEDGSGNLAQLLNHVYDVATNTSTADVYLPRTVHSNSWMVFTNTQRTPASALGTGVSDLRLWRPGYPTNDSVMFTTEFITAMQKFHVIRGMDFTATNVNPSVTWAERPTMAFRGFSETKGQPWEVLVNLANASGRDLWINVPVLADDAYITNLARLLRYGSNGVTPYTSKQTNPVYPPLASGLKVYVEYGNEIWNSAGGFYGFGWALGKANTYRNDVTHPIAFDGPVADPYIALRRWVAYRSAAVSLAFRGVFGSSRMMSTVRPVLSAQAGNGSIYLSEGLKWADAFYSQVRSSPLNKTARKVPELWWGAGGAAYYESSTPPNDTTETTMAAYFAGLPTAQFATTTATDAIWARGFGLASVAYEGGPGPGGNATGGVSGSAALSAAYNADPRMPARMQAAHDTYVANGGQFLSYYVYSNAAPWSFVDEQLPSLVSDTATPKLQAIDTIRTATKPAVALGKLAPSTITLRDTTASARFNVFGNTDWGYGGAAYRMSPGTSPAFAEFALVPVRASTARTYNIAVTTFNAPLNGRLEVLLNGTSLGSINMVASNTSVATLSASLPGAFIKGLNVVRIRSLSGDIWVKDVVVQ